MTCQDFGLELIDDAAPRTPELERHLAACPRCRELESAHHAAQRLRSLRVDFRITSETALAPSLWRRRLVFRGTLAALGAAVLAALFLAVPGVQRSPFSVTRDRNVAPIAEPLPVHTAEQDDSIRDLMREVDGYTRQQVSPHDEMLEAFGALPQLLTPEADPVSGGRR